ncbi:ribonuclease P protein component [Candidatus Endobugula sertula]|uniref:Ribonuclease P protein component n=1 Tax=Candidatus Endobugula sertula TaxID=62101 RepID=A0A1D2QSC6_9GAMM|nr:ribonuclease P protein component [Candidatus Endobugula sertula]
MDVVSPKKFCKLQRLLNAGDFQNVFSGPPFRSSHQHCLILAKPNKLSYARLGLIIAKKHIRLAVQRNRIKRLIRESFRQQQRNLVGIDAIVLARKGLGDLDNPTIIKIMNQQWLKIQKKAHSQNHKPKAE